MMVTHDPRILPYADRVYRMEDGLLRDTTEPVIPDIIGAL